MSCTSKTHQIFYYFFKNTADHITSLSLSVIRLLLFWDKKKNIYCVKKWQFYLVDIIGRWICRSRYRKDYRYVKMNTCKLEKYRLFRGVFHTMNISGFYMDWYLSTCITNLTTCIYNFLFYPRALMPIIALNFTVPKFRKSDVFILPDWGLKYRLSKIHSMCCEHHCKTGYNTDRQIVSIMQRNGI